MSAAAVLSTVLFATVAWGAQALAPDQPDFSGSWFLTGSTGLAGGPETLSVKQTLVQTNARGDAMKPFFKEISITRHSSVATTSETYQIGVVGGRVSVPGGVSTHERVVWEDRALVFETGSYTGPARETGTWSERREVWFLNSSAVLRVEITTRSSNAPQNSITQLYRRDAK